MMTCDDCELRKYYARVFDIHFDEKDCICKCPYRKRGNNNDNTMQN